MFQNYCEPTAPCAPPDICPHVSMFIDIYIYISSCPAGHLRHRAYFVLCSLFFVPQGSKKTNPQSNNNYQKRRPKLTENHEKVTPGGVPEALGGGLGTILVPRVARRRKRPENGLGDPPPGTRLGSKFRLFVDSVVLFPVVFLSVVLEGVRAQL